MNDVGLFKAEVLKEHIGQKFPNYKIYTITDSETFRNPANHPYLWDKVDIFISSVDDYYTIRALLGKAVSMKIPLIVIDAPRLTVTTHSFIPYLDSERDVESYKKRIDEKLLSENINLNSLILSYPTLTNHCVIWAHSIFSLVFTSFYYRLLEFENRPTEFIEKMEVKNYEVEYDLHIIGIIKFLYLEKIKHNFSNCVDLAIEIFNVRTNHPGTLLP